MLGFSPGWGKSEDRPESTPNPADAGCNSKLVQYSNTPSLRVAGFEDEDEAPHEHQIGVVYGSLWLANLRPVPTLPPFQGGSSCGPVPGVKTPG
jgi:hypothetical protein